MGVANISMTLTHYIGGKLVGVTADFPPSLNYPELTTFINSETFVEYILVNDVWEIIVGGIPAPITAIMATGTTGANTLLAETFDGTVWSNVNNVNTARRALMGGGNDNDAIIATGVVAGISTITETWNGTSWTTVNPTTTAKSNASGGGNSVDAIEMGGSTTATEEWNGITWSNGGALSVTRGTATGGGSSSDGISAGGITTLNTTEEYNGVSWSAGGTLVVGKQQMASGSHWGFSGNALTAGGFNVSELDDSETYNGTTWSAGGVLNTVISQQMGGYNGSRGISESGTGNSLLTETFIDNIWSNANNVNTGRSVGAGGGNT